MPLHRNLKAATSELTAAVAARALTEARSIQTASVGSVAVRNNDGTRTTIGTQTSTGNGIELGSTGDVTWQDGAVTKSARRLQAQLSEVQQKLADGGVISTSTNRNMVSVDAPPEDATGYQDGSYWSQVASPTDMTVTHVWKLVGGAWVEQNIDDVTLVAPTIDVGLINVASLAAKMIVSGELWSSATNPRYGITQDGFLGYDESGQETVHIDGADNRLAGTATLGGLTIRHWAHQGDTEGTSAIFRDTENIGPTAPESVLRDHSAISFVSGEQIKGAQDNTSFDAGLTMDTVRTIFHSSADADFSTALSQQSRKIVGRVTPVTGRPELPWDGAVDTDTRSSAFLIEDDRAIIRSGNVSTGSQGQGAWIRANPNGSLFVYGNYPNSSSSTGFGENRIQFSDDGSARIISDPDGVRLDGADRNYSGIIMQPPTGTNSNSYLALVGSLKDVGQYSTFKFGRVYNYGVAYGGVHTHNVSLPNADTRYVILLGTYSWDNLAPRAAISSLRSDGFTITLGNYGTNTGHMGCAWLAIRVVSL